ncbi:hypothetical protein G9A89_015694 [Geosiphon pyriformis]|nr:hypothetical protein G9A89_015694 [Geosiphon pyriformis]
MSEHSANVESAFNFYVNEKIAYLLETPVNTESAKETFYNKLIQNTSLPTNHNFASIITEINKKIEYHTQKKYPITYASKRKRKLQTPVKTRVELPTNPLYYYTPKSVINISSTGTFTLNSKQRKEDLLEPYGLQSPPPQSDFGTASPWEIMELEREQEEEEEKSKDQEFTY